MKSVVLLLLIICAPSSVKAVWFRCGPHATFQEHFANTKNTCGRVKGTLIFPRTGRTITYCDLKSDEKIQEYKLLCKKLKKMKCFRYLPLFPDIEQWFKWIDFDFVIVRLIYFKNENVTCFINLLLNISGKPLRLGVRGQRFISGKLTAKLTFQKWVIKLNYHYKIFQTFIWYCILFLMW